MRRLFCWLLVTVLLVPTLAGCDLTAEDKALVDSFIEEWARSKELHPLDEDGNISVGGLWNLGKLVTRGKTGDDEVDAVLGMKSVIDKLRRADGHMTDGQDLWDGGQLDDAADELDKAIDLRPGDWSYRSSRAALALQQGDLDTFEEHSAAGGEIAGEFGRDGPYLDRAIDDFEDTEDALGGTPASGDQCRALYDHLASLYGQRADLTGSDTDRAMAQGYRNQSSLCKP